MVVETEKAYLKNFSVEPVENGMVLKVGVSDGKGELERVMYFPYFFTYMTVGMVQSAWRFFCGRWIAGSSVTSTGPGFCRWRGPGGGACQAEPQGAHRNRRAVRAWPAAAWPAASR
ncbi:MAG: hypothetical protein MZV70_21195 [Desulfobacterales bacterium]|nr:hypothetical protein [Desulfobacterales bacterium]